MSVEIVRNPIYPFIDPRADGQPGYLKIVETTRGYIEVDGSDVRVKRVYVMTPDHRIEHSFLQDEMGARFVDNLGYPDRED